MTQKEFEEYNAMYLENEFKRWNWDDEEEELTFEEYLEIVRQNKERSR